MTREEAIRHIGDVINIENNSIKPIVIFEQEKEALYMAIEALQNLSKPNNGLQGSDLISRQDAIDAFGLSEKTRKYGGDHSGYNTMMLYEIQDVLESLTSADRPTGEWIEVTNGRGGHECSECHSYAPSYASGDEHLSDYCPNCGVKMGGESDG